jgi:phage shock protein A
MLRGTMRRWRGSLLASGLAICAAQGIAARAKGESSELISAEARAAIQQIYEAHRAERRYSAPMAELGRAVREVRLSLRELAAGAPKRGATEEARRLSAASERAQSLLRKMRSEADPSEAASLGSIQTRLDELTARSEEIVRSASAADRLARVRALIGELETSFPREERRDPGARRRTSWAFATAPAEAETGE